MGGKGKKRREKNYLAAHGGPARLPPPPDRSKQDALPAKLRILMNYTSPSPHDSAKQVVEKKEKKEKKTKAGEDPAKNVKPEKETKSEAKLVEEIKAGDYSSSSDQENDGVKKGDEKKKKRKRNQMTDLRFEKELAELDGRSNRKERKKKYWEAKKQKKNNKGKIEEDTLRENFPKTEKITFGDVVQAPPKLAVVPKARKTPMTASKERQRLEAIEAYRARNGWSSRPGSQIPTVIMP